MNNNTNSLKPVIHFSQFSSDQSTASYKPHLHQLRRPSKKAINTSKDKDEQRSAILKQTARQLTRMRTNILGQTADQQQEIHKSIKSNLISSGDVKRMRKTYNNIVMFGIQIYLHLPLFLAHILSSSDEAHSLKLCTVLKINSAIFIGAVILILSTILRNKVLNCQSFVPLRNMNQGLLPGKRDNSQAKVSSGTKSKMDSVTQLYETSAESKFEKSKFYGRKNSHNYEGGGAESVPPEKQKRDSYFNIDYNAVLNSPLPFFPKQEEKKSNIQFIQYLIDDINETEDIIQKELIRFSKGNSYQIMINHDNDAKNTPCREHTIVINPPSNEKKSPSDSSDLTFNLQQSLSQMLDSAHSSLIQRRKNVKELSKNQSVEINQFLQPLHPIRSPQQYSRFNKSNSLKRVINSPALRKQQVSTISGDVVLFQTLLQGVQKIDELSSRSSNNMTDNISMKSDSCSDYSMTYTQLSNAIDKVGNKFSFNEGSQKDEERMAKLMNNRQPSTKLSVNERDMIERMLNIYGLSYLFLMQILLVYLRSDFLNGNYLQQFSQYMLIYYLSNSLVYSKIFKIAYYLICYCSLQYPIEDKTITHQQRFFHILVNFCFLAEIVFQQYYQENFRSDSINNKITKIIESDYQLKSLVQKIPFGLAVLNLEDVNHYNSAFAKVLEITKQRQILKGIEKFERKIVKQDENHPLSKGIDLLKIQNGCGTLTQKKTALKDDLKFLLQNKDKAFEEDDNIFEIYYVDKQESQVFSPSTFQKQNTYSSHSTQKQPNARKFYSISISKIDWSNKNCLLITVKDITTEKLVDQKQLLDRLKNMIFQSFSHELKTPLNGIMMSIETSHFISEQLTNKLDKERSRGVYNLADPLNQSKMIGGQLKIMESCALILKNIMHDFFDYNMMQSNELVLNIKEFDLKETIKEIAKTIQHQLQSDKVKFNFKIEYQNINGLGQRIQDPDVIMKTDKERLSQILLNLLLNALKFTNMGQISLEVFVAVDKTVKFKVRDTGCGIDQNRLPYIFNLFENNNGNIQQYLQANHKSARMGLPISQNLCQMMGGQIFVKSQTGVGSTQLSETSMITKRTNPAQTPSEKLDFVNANSTEIGDADKYSQGKRISDNGSNNSFFLKQQSTKNIYLNKRITQVGSFEMVFKQMSSHDMWNPMRPHSLFNSGHNYQGDEYEDAPTPKLLQHSNTIAVGGRKQCEEDNQIQQAQIKFRKMRTSQIHSASPIGDQDIAQPNLLSDSTNGPLIQSKISTFTTINLTQNNQIADFKHSESQFSFINHQQPMMDTIQKKRHDYQEGMERISSEGSVSEVSTHQHNNLFQSASKENSFQNMLEEQKKNRENTNQEQTAYFSVIQMLSNEEKKRQKSSNALNRQEIEESESSSDSGSSYDINQGNPDTNYNVDTQSDQLSQINDASPLNKLYNSGHLQIQPHHFEFLEKSLNVSHAQDQDNIGQQSCVEGIVGHMNISNVNLNPNKEKPSKNNQSLDIKINEIQDTNPPISTISNRAIGAPNRNHSAEKEQSFKQYDRGNSYNRQITFQQQDSTSQQITKFIKQNFQQQNSNGSQLSDLKQVKNEQQEFLREVDDYLLDDQEEEKKETQLMQHQGNRIKSKFQPASFAYWPDSADQSAKSKSPNKRFILNNSIQSEINFTNLVHKLDEQDKRTNILNQSDIQHNLQHDENLYSSPIQRPDTHINLQNIRNTDTSNFTTEVDTQEPRCCPEFMIVDDVMMNRFVVEQMLTIIFQIKSVEAQNGYECVEALKEFYRNRNCNCAGIQMILMDIEMPILNGIEATKQLVTLMNTNTIPKIPIVALTAYLDESQNCFDAGMKGFLNKPTSKADLQDLIKKFNIRKNCKEQ